MTNDYLGIAQHKDLAMELLKSSHDGQDSKLFDELIEKIYDLFAEENRDKNYYQKRLKNILENK